MLGSRLVFVCVQWFYCAIHVKDLRLSASLMSYFIFVNLSLELINGTLFATLIKDKMSQVHNHLTKCYNTVLTVTQFYQQFKLVCIVMLIYLIKKSKEKLEITLSPLWKKDKIVFIDMIIQFLTFCIGWQIDVTTTSVPDHLKWHLVKQKTGKYVVS